MVGRLAKRLRPRKASTHIPLGAVRAMAAEDGTARWLAALAGMQVATQCSPKRWGERSVIHLYKGRGKNPLRFDSYRPIGIGHGVARLVDEIWEWRNGPWARRQAGLTQLTGRMGAAEAVAAHVLRIQLRKLNGLPTAVCYTDVQYGFDGGRKKGG